MTKVCTETNIRMRAKEKFEMRVQREAQGEASIIPYALLLCVI